MCGVIIAVTAWLYAPTRNFEFVNWDDGWYVLYNPLIQSWSLENLKGIATETVIRNYAPLTIFSFLIDYSLWGEWAGGYHLVNVALHAVNAVLVFFLVRQLTGRASVAAATALLFAVHPVHVESVAWVSSRKGLLSGALILGSLLCWLRPNRGPKEEAWGIAILALALLAKANAVVLPAIVLAYDVLVVRRRFVEAFVRQVIPGILCVWCLLANMSAQMTMLGGVRGHFALSKLEILAVDGIILWKYVAMLFWPEGLCVLYNPPTTGIWALAIAGAIGWACVFWWVWSRRSTQPLLLFAFASWMLLLFPVLNFFPITTLMNDRYLYLPSIAVLGATVSAIAVMIERVGALRLRQGATILAPVALLAATAGLMQRTREYLPVWRNDPALWEHAALEVPELSVVQIQRAISLYNAGETEAAITTLDYALAHCDPDQFDRERIHAKKSEWDRKISSD
jgi:hypothetical protein